MMKKYLHFACLAPLMIHALEVKPWIGNPYEFRLLGNYTHSHFNKVDNASPGLDRPSNDQLVLLGLGFTPGNTWDTDFNIEFVNTPRQSWGFRSAAVQLRRLWLDDILSDPISLTTGLNLRAVSQHSLKDVSSPYHSAFDMEMNMAMGKEWHKQAFWTHRIFAFGGLGIGNTGSPWTRAYAAFQANKSNRFRYELFSEGYWGFGPQKTIDINAFDGYGHIRHKSVDVGVACSYVSELRGGLSFRYAHRVYAESFPANTNFYMVVYDLPFSYF